MQRRNKNQRKHLGDLFIHKGPVHFSPDAQPKDDSEIQTRNSRKHSEPPSCKAREARHTGNLSMEL